MLNTVSSGCFLANGTSNFELKAALISRSFMPQRAPSHPTTSLSVLMHESTSLTVSRCGVAVQLGGEMGKFFSAAVDALSLTLALSCFGAGVRADEDGARLFRNTCGICHTLEPGKNRIGPASQALSAEMLEPLRGSTTPKQTRTRTSSGTRL